MASTAPVNNTGKRNSASLPPKRGKIKAQIYESIVEKVTFAASKAGEAFGMIRRGREDGGAGSSGTRGGGSSASTSPPDSAYPSDGYTDPA